MLSDGKYQIALISIHGLIRGRDLQLGRDADTGGQTKYVVELARGLAAHPDVGQVELLTRRIEDPKVDADYGVALEDLCPGARIVRLPCGPKRYLRKESLWPYLPSFVDHCLQHFRRKGVIPDWIHSHYADAGLVGAELVSLLGVPLVHTGHSLGRVKLARLLEKGVSRETMEKRYQIARRIEAEETTLDHASIVIASTRQEVEEQYSLYDNYEPERMTVIAPGVEIAVPTPEGGTGAGTGSAIGEEIDRFLAEPRKPLVLALARPDPRKNLSALVTAFGTDPELRKLANLCIVAGTRDDIRQMDAGPRKVLTELLLLIDRYDLYGTVAYPRKHTAADVPAIYRHAARRGGVFVNPALTEPFGLTLIEAAVHGLPVVATDDGGPRDIIATCENGELIDPLDSDKIARTLVRVLRDPKLRERWAHNGRANAPGYYSWSSHVRACLTEVEEVTRNPGVAAPNLPSKSRLATVECLLVTDIDNTLIGDRPSLERLVRHIAGQQHLAFGIATGRRLDNALEILSEWGVPTPDLLITAVGAEIYYGPRMVADAPWERHINYRWDPNGIHRALDDELVDHLRLQPHSEQRAHKISYYVNQKNPPTLSRIRKRLRAAGLHAQLILSHGRYLDVLPIRCTKGNAVRWVAYRWGIPLERVMAAGDSGNDESMLRGATPAVVVGNYSPELERLRGLPQVFFASATHAAGVLQGLEEHCFLTSRRRLGEPVQPSLG